MKAEFSVQSAYAYDRTTTLRWVISHLWRNKWLVFGTMGLFLTAWTSFSLTRLLIGQAAEEIVNPSAVQVFVNITLGVLFLQLLDSMTSLLASLSIETAAQRLEHDGRQELYEALLAKSTTWHDRQRVGDIMARSGDDMKMMNTMINPGVLFMCDMSMGLTVPIITLATINTELVLLPIAFVLSYVLLVRRYVRELNPVVGAERESYGVMNAGLEEAISGIEVVKASAQEPFERTRFRRNAKAYRDWFAKQGRIEGRYLPTLVYAVFVGAMFLHALNLSGRGLMGLSEVIAIMGLVSAMRFPIEVSIWTFSMLQVGLASADRVLKVIKAEAEIDENSAGHTGNIAGEIRFEDVSFAFEDGKAVLSGLSFTVKPGQTVAIVGQTGSGKSTLTDLINRTYDATAGRVLIDGVDVREWNLASLRGQIGRIEQDVFLFSRTIRENIAFGAPDTPLDKIEQAAREAQAHDFITSFQKGYETVVGERGTMLSGGQRQRIALARAFLSNPRILILDDSTSAIDSATEDEIQKAIRRAQQGRTTLLITHRLSQIRWADHIIVLDRGQVTASGTHEQLLRTSAEYRRIFARYDAALPPLETEAVGAAD
jgi:ATP-binding cassette subfamily B protein